ncbi:hypothetical protein [Nostoc linckia]|uniref:hypothetical protein n=1 Tax=Nostoc linckia TaxID=92942 RepID=UPI00117E64FB|nr:hypothetical protein [Nostoc linckia]
MTQLGLQYEKVKSDRSSVQGVRSLPTLKAVPPTVLGGNYNHDTPRTKKKLGIKLHKTCIIPVP